MASEYRVSPLPISALTRQERRALLGGLPWPGYGCLALILFVPVLYVVGSILESLGVSESDLQGVAVVAAWGIVVTCTLALTCIVLIVHYQSKQTDLVAQNAQHAAHDAQEATSRALSVRTQASHLLTELPSLIKATTASLEQAKAEYAENAFAPFWDAVEQAAANLGKIHSSIQGIHIATDTYQHQLQGRPHNFPPRLLTKADLPDIQPLLQEFKSIVRMGQTNFEFAVIWEHRKTREVLLAGFRTLGEAIANLGAAIEASLSSLESTLSYGFAAVSDQLAAISEEQVATRQTIDDLPERLRRDP